MLYSDYSVACSTPLHVLHQAVALVLIIGFCFGTPVLLLRSMSSAASGGAHDARARYYLTHRLASELRVSEDAA